MRIKTNTFNGRKLNKYAACMKTLSEVIIGVKFSAKIIWGYF